MNDLFSHSKQLKYFIKRKPTKKQIKQFEILIKYNNKYPNVISKKQIKFIVDKYKNEGRIDLWERLINLIQRKLSTHDVKIIEDMITQGGDDENIYQKLREHEFSKHTFTKYKSQLDFFAEEIKKYNPKSYLDIGCGDGYKTMFLAQLLGIDNTVCFDIKSWFGYNTKKKVAFKEIKEIGAVKDERRFDLITLIHTLHHWCYPSSKYYIKRMKSIVKLLNPGGIIVIFEHFVIEDSDAVICDIEHSLYERVLRVDENYYNIFKAKYLNPIEIDILMKKSGAKKIKEKLYNEGSFMPYIPPTRSFMLIYQKNINQGKVFRE